MLGELLSICRRIFGLRPNFLKHSQNSHFDCNDPALIHSSTVWSEFSLYFRRPMLEFCNTRLSSLTRFPIFIELTLKCRISANSFCGNYSFLNLEFQIVNKLNFCCGNYSREETIQRQKLFAKMMMNY